MARAFEHLIMPRMKSSYLHSDLKAMELVVAREILAEVFSVELPEVDAMIKSRFEEDRSIIDRFKEEGLWPREFRLDR